MSEHQKRKLNKMARTKRFSNKSIYELNRFIKDTVRSTNFWDTTGEDNQLPAPPETIDIDIV